MNGSIEALHIYMGSYGLKMHLIWTTLVGLTKKALVTPNISSIHMSLLGTLIPSIIEKRTPSLSSL